jgi:hypothetical protein
LIVTTPSRPSLDRHLAVSIAVGRRRSPRDCNLLTCVACRCFCYCVPLALSSARRARTRRRREAVQLASGRRRRREAAQLASGRRRRSPRVRRNDAVGGRAGVPSHLDPFFWPFSHLQVGPAKSDVQLSLPACQSRPLKPL